MTRCNCVIIWKHKTAIECDPPVECLLQSCDRLRSWMIIWKLGLSFMARWPMHVTLGISSAVSEPQNELLPSISVNKSIIQWKSYFWQARPKVPQVSAISSTKMAILSFTSPTNTILATSFAFFLCEKVRKIWNKCCWHFNTDFSLNTVHKLVSVKQVRCSLVKLSQVNISKCEYQSVT